MELLLDTHTVIWFSENNGNLSDKAKYLISDTTNNCFVSIVSIWEMAIKIRINKLKLEINLTDFVDELKQRGFVFLPINIAHTILVSELDLHHNDPFDRLLISQSIIEKKQIISRDNIFDNYGIERIW
jgi:PIN domain nuclease of toxin-antitoxin system